MLNLTIETLILAVISWVLFLGVAYLLRREMLRR